MAFQISFRIRVWHALRSVRTESDWTVSEAAREVDDGAEECCGSSDSR